jgi:hypothetical protein
MKCECQTKTRKQKKDASDSNTTGIDVDTASKLLFDSTKPNTPLYDPFSLPSPLSNYISNQTNTIETEDTIPQHIQTAVITVLPTQPSNTCIVPLDTTYITDTNPPQQPNAGAVTSKTPQDKIDELVAQNARMEKLLAALTRKMDYMQAQISGAASPNAHLVPATASWKLPSCEMLECNKKFLDLLGYSDNDNSITTFFQLGACNDAMGRVRQKIEYSIKNNVPINELSYAQTLVVPMWKKSREVVMLYCSVVICLDSPFPVMTTVVHKELPSYKDTTGMTVGYVQ